MKLVVSASKLKKKRMEELDPEIWGKIPLELYWMIKDIFLRDIKLGKRPEVKIRIRLDLFNYVSFYFGYS